MSNDVLQDVFQQYIHKSKYSRWVESLKRREHWTETVDRYMEFFRKFLKETHDYNIPEAEYKRIRKAIVDLDVMPSMRGLMTAGPALERDNGALYNCAFMVFDRKRKFDELMYILMCGSGVGFSVERQYINKLPIIADEFHQTETTIHVADSKTGWAASFKELISLLYAGQIPKWDLSKVRPTGSRLKVFGGVSSGPGPLEDLFKFTIQTFESAAGRKLNSIEVHDIACKVGETIVVGGVRRSALISLSNLSDPRMREAKSGQWWIDNGQRSMANNSVAYTEKPDIGVFLEEWLSLYRSKSGERGIFNRQAIQDKTKSLPDEKRNHELVVGTNPCFHGHTRILTTEGYLPFWYLEEKDDIVFINKDGEKAPGKVWSSGVKETVDIKWSPLVEKRPICCTPDHRFMLTDGTECEAKDLKGKQVKFYTPIRTPDYGDDFLMGFCVGDGQLNRLNSNEHLGIEINFSTKDTDITNAYGLVKGTTTEYSREYKSLAVKYELPPVKIGDRGLPMSIQTAEGLSGLFSANGCVISNHRVAIKSIDQEQLIQLKEVLLDKFEIHSYITTNKPKDIQFSNGIYTCKQYYDLNISRYASLLKFCDNISFGQSYKRDALDELMIVRAPVVQSVKYADTAEVYDFSEPKTNWGVVENVIAHNCSEIILRDDQFCNLSSIVLRLGDTIEDIVEKVRIATILGTWQASVTNFKYISSTWKKNCEEEALLGVSMTGIMDHPLFNDPHDKKLPQRLNELRDFSIAINNKLAKKIGINPAAAVTCIKPEGTTSSLVGASSGIHARHSEYYIRTVRGIKSDPLCTFLAEVGVPYEDDVTSPSTGYVFSFPIKSPDNAIVREDRSAIDQLELWKVYQDHFCEHKPSITVTVKEHEWIEVAQWVYKHFNEISGVSFLPYADHTYRQAPFQEITKEEYNEAVKKMPEEINWDNLSKYEAEDNTKGSQELSCSGGSCEVI